MVVGEGRVEGEVERVVKEKARRREASRLKNILCWTASSD